MSKHKSYREESRKNWGTHQVEALNAEQIQTGALLRIADATEVMSQNYVALQNQVEREQKISAYWLRNYLSSERSRSSLKGQITKLRKRLAELEGKSK